MPRIPTRIQQNGIGGFNPAAPSRSPGARPSVSTTGPAQPLEQTGDRAANQVQQNTAQAVNQSKANPFANGNLIQGINWVNGTAQKISHQLGIPFAGFFVVNARSLSAGTPLVTQVADVEGSFSTPQPSARIALLPAGTFTSDLWVYA